MESNQKEYEKKKERKKGQRKRKRKRENQRKKRKKRTRKASFCVRKNQKKISTSVPECHCRELEIRAKKSHLEKIQSQRYKHLETK